MQRMQQFGAHDRRGGALVMMTVLIAALAGLSVALLTMTSASHKETHAAKEKISARLAAEAGIDLAYLALRDGASGAIATTNYAGSTYAVTSTQTLGGNPRVTLTATGTSEHARGQVQLTVQKQIAPLFAWGAFGRDSAKIDGAAKCDRYNSAGGGVGIPECVGSNGDIALNHHAEVDGNATPGPTGTVTIGPNAQLNGSSNPAANPAQLPGLDVPAVASAGAYNVAANATQSIGPGTYHYSSLTVSPNGTLDVVGPTTLICDDFDLQSQGRISVNSLGGGLELVVIDNFQIGSDCEIASASHKPKDVAIRLASDNLVDPSITVDFNANLGWGGSDSKVYATIFAPQSKILINSNFELFGAVIARQVEVTGHSRLHYDVDLAVNGPLGPAHYKRLSWQVLE